MPHMFGFCLAILTLSPADAPRVPAFMASAADGRSFLGKMEAMQKDWSVTLAGEKPGAIAGVDLISLRRADTKLPAFPVGPHIIFANGDRVAGEVLAIEKERVRFKARLGAKTEVVQELSIPLSALAIIWFSSPSTQLARQWQSERRRRDLILLNNGDTPTGTVVGFKSIKGPFQFEESGKTASVEFGNVVAVALNTDLARTLRPKGQYGPLVLANAGRVSLASAAGDEQLLTGQTLFGTEVRIPWNQIVSLDIRQGKAVDLSDLKPKSYEFMPYLSEYYSYQMDRSVELGELRLAAST